MRHKHVVDTTTYPNDPSDPRVQGDEWNANHVMPALSADPADPDPGEAVMWLSDGTGTGDAGDVFLKVNIGGTTKTLKIFDYSVLP